MKKLIYISLITFNFQLLTLNCFCQWVQQVSGVTSSLLDIDFINSQTGWACGDGGVILKTTNGGANWIAQNSGVFKRLEGIDAIDANNLFCVGWFQTILKSTNGGTNWIILRDGQVSTTPSFFKCFFLNSNTGWLLRSGGYILRTTNGGNTFDSSNVVFSFLWDIFFKDALTGVLCGDGATVMKSSDGGVTWNLIPLPLLTGAPNLYRLSFVADFGWTIGEGSEPGLGKMVFRTTNFGSSWDSIARVAYPNNTLNYAVFFSSINTGWCGGTFGHIFKSTNGGFNWIQQTVPIDGYRGDFWFANDSNGWVVGGGGYILHTTNGGTYVNIVPISHTVPTRFKLYQNFPNPFNGETVIEFDINTSDFYELAVYDILGRKMESLFTETLEKGSYKVNYNGNKLSSGAYIYILSSQQIREIKKFILIK